MRLCRILICLFVTLPLAACASVSSTDTLPAGGVDRARPNVVFILADDLGWRDTSLYGSTFYETPHIDRLAARGMMFHNAYAANPLCSPTRASILTGQYPGRLRLTTPSGHVKRVVLDPVVPDRGPVHQKVIVPQSRTRLPIEYYTLAEALRDAGYRTAHFGKWHLGIEPYHPQNQGFELARPGGSFPGPPGGYFAPFRGGIYQDSPDGEHIDDRITREAIDWIRQHKDEPFFLNFWFFSVHARQMGKEDLIAKYRAKADPANPQRNPIMGAMIETTDTCVGQLINAIDEMGLAERTVIVFTSDNGGISWQEMDGAPLTSNLPLRNGKASIYEGGSREPLVVVWPGAVAPGSRSDAVVSSIDHYPTFLEMLDIEPQGEVAFDGISIVPALQGRALEREAIFCHFPHYVPKSSNLPGVWVRKGDWKLIRFFGDGEDGADRFELYDLKNDIGETRNLAKDMPERVKELNGLITEHLEATDCLVPKRNPRYRPVADGEWSGNQVVRLSRKNDRLQVRSTGNDPFLTCLNLDEIRGPATFEVRMRSDSRGAAQVFWAGQPHGGFRGGESVTLSVEHDSEWHDYRAKLPAGCKIRALRFDPCAGEGQVVIDTVRLVDEQGTTIREWRFPSETERP